MANALKTLFQDIADAIKEKTGDTASMKPAEFPEKISGISTGTDATILENIPIALDFSGGDQIIAAPDGTLVKTAIIQKPDTLIPENIAQGVNIAGIIGALAGGSGGGGSGEWLFSSGTFKPDVEQGYVLTHNIGAIPDIFVVSFDGQSSLSGSKYYLASLMAMSEKFFGAEATAAGISHSTSLFPSSSTAQITFHTKGLEKITWSSYTSFGDFTTTTVKLGGLFANLFTGNSQKYKWMALTKV